MMVNFIEEQKDLLENVGAKRKVGIEKQVTKKRLQE
jgi:hypothetical protein